MKGLSARWQKLIVWLTGYLGIIPFVVAGGYIHQKTEDEDVKISAKTALVVTAVFTAIDVLLLIVRNALYLGDAATAAIVKTGYVIAILKAVCFVTLFILDMAGVSFTSVKKEEKKSAPQEQPEREENSQEEQN